MAALPKVGDYVPNMPDEYANRGVMGPGMSLLMAVDNCPRGSVIFVKEHFIVAIQDFPPDPFDVPDHDAVIINDDDLSEEQRGDIMKQVKTRLQ